MHTGFPTTTTANRGYSLLELIAALLIAGMIASVSAMWISGATRGFVFARQNSALAQKGQIAMTRLTKELNVLADVSASSATALSFGSYKLNVKGNHTIAWAGNGADLLLDNDPLTDLVQAFALAWLDSPGDTTPQSNWDSNQRIVQITLTLNGPENNPTTFTKRIRPRNLGN